MCHPLFCSEELEPNICVVHRQLGTYVLFYTSFVKYITYFNESSFTKFIKISLKWSTLI